MDDAAPSTTDSPEQTFIRQLGRRVRAARENAGISQSRLEREADLRPTTIARLERGELDLAVYDLARVAAVLAVDAPALFPAADAPQ
jgi:transcriptional regulator with XRE-family HTH domain